MENRNELSTRAILRVVRGVTVFGIFFLIKSLVFFFTLNMASNTETQLFNEFPLWAIGLIVTVGSLFIYNSLLRVFSLYDAHEMDEYLKKLDTPRRFFEYKRFLFTPSFILETSAAVALLAVFIPVGLFPEAEYLFAFAGGAKYLLIYLIYISSFVLLGLNARYETRRHWRQLYEERELDSLGKRWKFLLKLLLIFIIYPVSIPLSPVLIFTLFNVFTVLRAVLGLFSLLGITVTAAALLFLLLALPKIRVISVRRKFVGRLKATAVRSGYEICGLRFVKSLRLGSAGSLHFTLKHSSDVFTCRLIAIEKKRLPLYFTSEKNAHFLYKLGFKKHFVSLSKHFEYGFEGEGRRIIILAPEPKYVFVASDGGTKRLFTGDKMWKYTVFEGESFFGAMDRHCLDKSSGMFE